MESGSTQIYDHAGFLDILPNFVFPFKSLGYSRLYYSTPLPGRFSSKMKITGKKKIDSVIVACKVKKSQPK
jgi:hypothetical protein